MKTTRDTVRLVKRLFEKGGAGNLEDRRKGPKKPGNKIEPQVEELIRNEYSQGSIKTLTNFRKFFNRKYGFNYSYKVFRRVLDDLRKKRRPKKNQETQKNLLERKDKGSFKDVVSGITFISYTYSLSLLRPLVSLAENTAGLKKELVGSKATLKPTTIPVSLISIRLKTLRALRILLKRPLPINWSIIS